jgi:hypothetical protein
MSIPTPEQAGMIPATHGNFFSVLVGDVLHAVSSVEVTVSDGTWPLSDSLVFQLEAGGLVQILVDVEGQEVIRLRDEHEVRIRGEYDDLISRRLVPLAVPNVELPAAITSVVEFRGPEGKVIGAEIQTACGAFSVLLYPEDVEVRPRGAVWKFVCEHGLPQLGHLTVVHIDRGTLQHAAEPPGVRGP